VMKVLNFCLANLKDIEFVIVIVDNNSIDQTGAICKKLSMEHREIEYIFVSTPGKGIAISSAWQKYDADYYCFMDADLATNLLALPVAILKAKQGFDVVVGSRFHKQSKVERSVFRGVISQCYRVFVKVLFNLKINDIPCGFKLVSRGVRDGVLSEILDKSWFWDTEMLVLADKKGFSMAEVPVVWSEFVDVGRESKVNILATARDYLIKSILLKKRIEEG